MTLSQFVALTKPFIEGLNQFTIQRTNMNDTNGQTYYKNSVNENVKPNYGIYAVCDTRDNSVIYIGKGGTIKNNGVFGNQNLNGRLKAPRGVYNNSYEYFKKVMNDNSMENLTFFVVYSNSDNPPAYIEAVALLDFYKQNSALPLLNNEF
ncbi:MAG: hypothetical protein RL308_2940 [Bacteroidota bacterium]|jgi:hypothetical protein